MLNKVLVINHVEIEIAIHIVHALRGWDVDLVAVYELLTKLLSMLKKRMKLFV